ncbi:penicillin-binding protein [Corynebacterium sp. zg-331]|uniref:transglycosylase domain-containing protein n=1 Tax=unclassified Corynebacterium TaxID=2624378 RepID=UPI00128E57CF|nr:MULTISPECIES: transglycosylase domain-containing protein [unclassified Corynebacterium]MBC3186537.1 penicillin-binding protein [Corynebacterium sp. zg-331]MPV53020.1 penicillin-binding protein [Corynebacterium sp. zg331]
MWTSLGVLGLLIILPIAGFMAAYIMAKVPEPEELSAKQVSQIFTSDSSEELARIVPPDGNRQQIPYEQIPEGMRNAVLAAEDREFWTNPGFSITGFGRAVLGQLRGDSSAGGGSTITQQYVKNMLVGNEHSIERKLRELVYSTKMANEWSKEEVLSAYLNTVYFGRNAYGVESAAQAYFGKHAAELTPEESAVLAAAIQRPSQLDPWINRSESELRWNYVLDGMVEIGGMTPQQRAHAVYPAATDPASYSAYTEADGTNGMIKNQVMAELEALGITEQDVTTRGLKITTTIDKQAQAATVNAVHNNLQGEQPNLRTAAVSVEPATGAVRAYYGGEDAHGWDYANAALQTGSTFKIFGLAAALQQGIPLSTGYSSDPVTLPGGITVNNVEGFNCGFCSIKDALKYSHNTSFIRLQNDLANGTQDTADMAHALGIERSLPGIPQTLTENGEQPYEGIVLGQYQSRPLDMAVAVATLTNRGVWQQPHFVQKVETANREMLYEREAQEGERRVSEVVADNVIDAMQPIAAYSNGKTLAGGRASASKTGTTQLGDTGYNKDAWMVGSTPQLATAVWVGTEDNSPLLNAWGGLMYGSGLPTDIWKATLDGALEGRDFEDFAPAGPITWATGTYGGGYVAPGTVTGSSLSSWSDASASSADSAPAGTNNAEASGPAAPQNSPAPQPAPDTQAPVPAAPAPQPAAPSPQPAPAPAPQPAPGPNPRDYNQGGNMVEILPNEVGELLGL